MVKQAWMTFFLENIGGESSLTLSCQEMAVACYGLGVLKHFV